MPKKEWMIEMHSGVYAGEKIEPIETVALYVPRGKGAFPSVAMMTSIPAVVAGVKNPIIFTPPEIDGSIDSATLVAASIAGVENVYSHQSPISQSGEGISLELLVPPESPVSIHPARKQVSIRHVRLTATVLLIALRRGSQSRD